MATTHTGCQTGTRHVFRLVTLDTLRIVLQDSDGVAFADMQYQFVFDGVAGQKQTTNGRGLAEALVPDDVNEASLVVWPDEQNETLRWEWPLSIAPQQQAVNVTLEDDDGNPLGNAAYQFVIDGTEGERKTTDEYGTASEDVPHDATAGTLRIWFDDPDSSEPVEVALDLSSGVPVDVNDHIRNRTRDLRMTT